MILHRMRGYLAVLLLGFATSASASVVYSFTFTRSETGQVAGTGTFTTGNAAVDPGYFLLTDLTFTAILDPGQNGVLNTGSLSTTFFASGAAFSPADLAFVNHNSGNTYDDFGGAFLTGSVMPAGYTSFDLFPGSFTNGLIFFGTDLGTESFFYEATLAIVGPAATGSTVPEPPVSALVVVGLLAAGAGRRQRRLRSRRSSGG